uniref:Uncharacterized protein n=1 Tax=Arcella intermedia TaxID=1963864 RepID=A0A6B2LUI1_9EUKA
MHGNIVSFRNSKGMDMPPVFIVGSDGHKEDKRVISTDSGEHLASELGCVFMEASAKVPNNVTELFESCARLVIQQRNSKSPNQPNKIRGGCALL